MIDAATRGLWRNLEDRLRPFILRRVAVSADVDDILQDIFTRMQANLDGLRHEERFGPWVYKIAHNAIVDHYRRQQRHPSASHDSTRLEVAEDTAEAASAEQELASYLAPFVAMLDAPYRQALTLVEFEGVSQKQAAEMLGLSVSGMKTRVQRARAQLAEAFHACCTIELDVRGRVVDFERKPNGKLPEGCCEGNGCSEREATLAQPSAVEQPEIPKQP